jgi:hypothetical protein
MDGGLQTQRDSERATVPLAAQYEQLAVAAAYRRFLGQPGVESDFHAVRALAHRVPAAARMRQALGEQATAAEVDAGRVARAHDEDHARGFRFAIGTAMAVGLAGIDAVPAFLAAQAFGLDLWTTVGIAAVLVAALAAAMWAVTHRAAGWRRWAVAGALAAGLAMLGALRWWYLIVTAGDPASAALEAGGLTVFTALLVWFGFLVLGHTEPHHVSAAARRARGLRRRAERATAHELEIARRAGAALREFLGRAQVFAWRELDDRDARAQLLERVRREVERGTDATVAER